MNVKLIQEIIKAQPKIFVVIVALLLSNACLYLYASVYQSPRLESLQNKWFEKRKSATGGPHLDTSAVYRQGKNDLKLWNARILPKKEYARFIGSLFDIAANNSLVFKGVTYKVVQLTDENLVAYSLDFNVTGKYAAVKSFLSDIGRMRDIVTIDNISLNNSKVIEDAVTLKVQLTVYLRMEEK
jgi:type IV pilus assembly protein PilO